MGNITVNIIRFFVFFLLQILLFKQFRFGWGAYDYVMVLIYPLFILLLPVNTPRWLQLILAFVLGLFIDRFYDSPGVHASALVFTAFVRLIVLSSMEPPEKYPINGTLDMQTMGRNWFLTYAGILMVFHLFFYFSVEAFSYRNFFVILVKVVMSWIGSMTFIIILMLLGSIINTQNRNNRVRRI